MDGWTELRDDDDDHGGDDEGKFGVAFNHDFHIEKVRFDSCKESLRSLFDQVLVASMREKSISKCTRPTPVLLGDGRPVDLFKLFWIVRKIGGYDVVSRNNLWGFVLEECGLRFGVISSIKLIYMKYLSELDQWLRRAFSKTLFEGGYTGLVGNLDLLSQELEMRFRDMLSDKKMPNNDSRFWKSMKGRGEMPIDISESELHITPNGRTTEQAENIKKKRKKNGNPLSGNDQSRLSPGRTAETMISEEPGNVERSVHNEYAASAKRVVEEAVNEANGFSRGLLVDESGESCKEGGGQIIASAEEVTDKVIDKVLYHGETIRAATDNDVDNERFSVHDKSDICISAKEVAEEYICKTHDLSENNIDDKESFTSQQGIDNMAQERSDDIGNVLGSRKRKRQFQSFVGMLNWLIHVAKHSDDPSVGLIPECSKWSDYGNEEYWSQAILVREALLIKRHPKTNAGENLVKDQQKKPRMHPSMYEDNVPDPQSTEKQRSTKRIPSLTKPYVCPCCKPSAAHRSKDITHQERDSKSLDSQVKLVLTDPDKLPTYLNDHDSSDFPKKQVSVGPLFQAEVPEWTGMPSESDPKWLGKRIWPPENGDKNSMFKLYGIGKGRQHICDCAFPNSVECVRFHIAEKRLMLKQELGSLFYQWRFNHMGEEVSLSWTEEEEKIFKEMMRSYSTFSNEFWWNAPKFLPSKTREKLVSYYFNVFLVQRRSYQNRVTPVDIDSDDDEKECGNIGTGFGYNALYICGSSSITCTLNKMSTEFV